MRPDMQEVIIERPRVGGHAAHRDRRKTYLNDYRDDRDIETASKEGIDHWVGYENKEQTDVLGPLYGFLRKNVGRPWDKIWSEICEHCRGFMGQHLKTHVRQLVVENARINKNGEVTDERGYAIVGSRYYEAFYVHPETGLLAVPKACRTKYQYEKPKTKIVRLNGQDYYKHNGIWYRVTTEKAPEEQKTQLDFTQSGPGLLRLLRRKGQHYYIPFDVFGHGGWWTHYSSMINDLCKAYGESVYCTSKQQANKKECRKLNKLYSA